MYNFTGILNCLLSIKSTLRRVYDKIISSNNYFEATRTNIRRIIMTVKVLRGFTLVTYHIFSKFFSNGEVYFIGIISGTNIYFVAYYKYLFI